VDDLAFPRDIIKTNYGSKGKVVEVSKFSCYGLPVFTIIYVPVDAEPNKDGSYREIKIQYVKEDPFLKFYDDEEGEVEWTKIFNRP